LKREVTLLRFFVCLAVVGATAVLFVDRGQSALSNKDLVLMVGGECVDNAKCTATVETVTISSDGGDSSTVPEGDACVDIGQGIKTLVVETRYFAFCSSTTKGETCLISTNTDLYGVTKQSYRFWESVFLTSTSGSMGYETFFTSVCSSETVSQPQAVPGKRVCAKP